MDPLVSTQLKEVDNWNMLVYNSKSAPYTRTLPAKLAYNRVNNDTVRTRTLIEKCLQEYQTLEQNKQQIFLYMVRYGADSKIPCAVCEVGSASSSCSTNNNDQNGKRSDLPENMCLYCGMEGQIAISPNLVNNFRSLLVPICITNDSHRMHLHCLYPFVVSKANSKRKCPLCEDYSFDSMYLLGSKYNVYRQMWESWAEYSMVTLPSYPTQTHNTQPVATVSNTNNNNKRIRSMTLQQPTNTHVYEVPMTPMTEVAVSTLTSLAT